MQKAHIYTEVPMETFVTLLIPAVLAIVLIRLLFLLNLLPGTTGSFYLVVF